MEVVVLESADAIGELVADTIVAAANMKPTLTLGLATGSSPLPTYRFLANRYEVGDVSLAHASAFLLDEYIGLTADHPETYANFIQEHFTRHVDVAAENVRGPDARSDDLLVECADYERRITESGGVDIQLLGIGTDGHVGFNEPASSLASRTRLKTLTTQTRQDNARFFASLDEVPRHVLTQGLGTILEARHLVLIATGANKAKAIAAAVEGPVTAMCPASILQMHPHATVLVDGDAAADLQLLDYFTQCWANKPSWQLL